MKKRSIPRPLNGPRQAKKAALYPTRETVIQHALEATHEAYVVVEAMRQPLEGAEAVLSLIMRSCEGVEGTQLPNVQPHELWQALNLARAQVRAARTASTIKGDALTNMAGVLKRLEP